MLLAAGLSEPATQKILQLRPAVTVCESHFIAHDHWPPSDAEETNYVYFGTESSTLLSQLQEQRDRIKGSKILDLGSGAGSLSLAVAADAREVIGIEAAAKAVVWAQANADGQGYSNKVRFRHARIGTPEAYDAVDGLKFDIALMNPPMVLAIDSHSYPHRNGGELGIELPFLFLEFAHIHLKRGGFVMGLCTNPIVHGKGLFFDRLSHLPWDVLEKRCLNPRFNQSLYRKERYHERGVDRVELWYIFLRKK